MNPPNRYATPGDNESPSVRYLSGSPYSAHPSPTSFESRAFRVEVAHTFATIGEEFEFSHPQNFTHFRHVAAAELPFSNNFMAHTIWEHGWGNQIVQGWHGYPLESFDFAALATASKQIEMPLQVAHDDAEDNRGNPTMDAVSQR